MISRARRPRRLILIAAVAVLLAGVAGPVSAADPILRSGGKALPVKAPDRSAAVFPVPAGTLGFQSYLGWEYDDGSIAVVGEVLNNTTTRRKAIGLRVTYYTSNQPGATPLGSTTDTVLLDGVARGAVGPFVVFKQTPPSGTGAFQIEITTSTPVTVAAGGGLDIVPEPTYLDAGTRYYPGTIHNPNTFAVDQLRVILTAYDTAGNVIEVMPDTPVGPVAAGASASYLIGISDTFPLGNPPVFTAPSKVSLIADGYRADQPTVYVPSWGNYFDDLLGSTFRNDIAWLAEQGITKGCAPGRYCPDASVTRGEMATFLARAVDLPATSTDYFSDDNGTTHEPNINRIAAAGITKGCTPTTYCPNANVTRGQMAAFLRRALQ